MKPTKAGAFSVAALVGLAAGWYLAARHVERHQAALFSANRLRRLAALGYLASRGQPDTVGLLRDYIAWEPVRPLRNRAIRLVRRLELELA